MSKELKEQVYRNFHKSVMGILACSEIPQPIREFTCLSFNALADQINSETLTEKQACREFAESFAALMANDKVSQTVKDSACYFYNAVATLVNLPHVGMGKEMKAEASVSGKDKATGKVEAEHKKVTKDQLYRNFFDAFVELTANKEVPEQIRKFLSSFYNRVARIVNTEDNADGKAMEEEPQIVGWRKVKVDAAPDMEREKEDPFARWVYKPITRERAVEIVELLVDWETDDERNDSLIELIGGLIADVSGDQKAEAEQELAALEAIDAVFRYTRAHSHALYKHVTQRLHIATDLPKGEVK